MAEKPYDQYLNEITLKFVTDMLVKNSMGAFARISDQELVEMCAEAKARIKKIIKIVAETK